MVDQRAHTTVDIGATYQEGMMTAIRLFNDNLSTLSHMSFNDLQKGKFMGWCGITRWCDVPRILMYVAATKTDDDLQTVLAKHWGQNKSSLNSMFYSVYWTEDLMTAIWKVILNH